MATTLREFLEERARGDLLSAEYIYKHAVQGAAMGRRLQQLQQIAQMLKLFDSPVLNHAGITIQKHTLDRVSLMMLSIAGEGIKKLEDEVPDIHTRLPSFPWASFKKLRDLNVKYGESVTSDDDIVALTKKLNKEIEAINKPGAFDGVDPHLKDLPYFYLICVCINWGKAIDKFAEAFATDEVSLKPSPALKELSNVIGMPQADIPLFLEAQSARDCLHLVSDQMKKPSIFFRRLHPKLYDTSTSETLRGLRNKYAHFEDFFEADSKTTKEDYFLNLVIFDKQEFASLKTIYQNIILHLGRVRDALHYGATNDYALQTARDYEHLVLGSSYNDADKKALMDEMIEWATRNTIKPRNVDAFVIATGNLLQRATVREAREVLSYVCSHKNELSKPAELFKGLGGQSHLVQSSVRRFIDSMQRGLGATISRSAA